MAEGSSLLQVTVNFEGNRSVLHLPKDLKVGKAIQKAAEVFKQDPSGLTFLYHGLEITDDMTVGVALGQAHNVTVIHLIKASTKKNTTARILPSLEPKECVYGHCKECESLVSCREVFLCKHCKENGIFQRSLAIDIDHFAMNVNPEHLKGACGKCGKEGMEAAIQFECMACDDGTKVSPLRQIRTNIHNIKCMKCGLRKDTVFRFVCNSGHCMCLDCFSNMCKQQLNARKFRNFEGMGFSIGCPGSGVNCKSAPVPDPHHFKIVEDAQFYTKFMDMSIEQYQPSGDNILCSCKTVIDFQRSKPVDVTEPEGAMPSISGLKWYHRMLGLKAPPPPPRVRRRTSCGKCHLTYCVACKQVWHEGDCRMINADIIEEEQAYPIKSALAKESCWPRED